MFRKAVSGIMLTFLLVGLFSLAINVKPAKSTWTGTVYIRADGSIDPPDAPIITYDNVTYTLTDNITSSADGIVVETDNIVINGNGYTINGAVESANSGIELLNRVNVTIQNINIQNFNYGIYLESSSNTVISGNNITNNKAGIYFYYSSNSAITGNNITNNWYGIELSLSSSNTVSGNNITNNWYGILLIDSSNTVISGNNIAANDWEGVWLNRSTNNTVSGNNIANNYDGIYLLQSSNNKIYHNNFMNNINQVSSEVSINVWDDGYPSGGNYWSDYAGVDADGDGIGDTPYVIDDNNIDHYPLMGPFNSFNTSVGYFVDVVSNSTIGDFTYFESNSTIVMHVSNMTANQTVGFCRLTIPHEVMSPPYTVKVNGTEVECKTIYENYTEGVSIIYFTYEHSRLEIVITPEFPSITILLLMLMVISIIASVKRKVLRRKFPI